MYRIHKGDSEEVFDDIVKTYIAKNYINGCGTYPHYFYNTKEKLIDK